ncbi:legumain-like [Sinocyclocheilus grahami]|uniref:legumain-like n=1 Tax=Sinocyclocheilus grahami TaxID=75366 RepID=UPI0007AC9225|nr:PREDICTED: legumain-like [Sinocyclocheilus grahami]
MVKKRIVITAFNLGSCRLYAVTSTKAEEKGYACYYDKVRKTFLSDEFSAVWMHCKEKVNLDKATFQDQFDYLQKKMKLSCSCRFGDMTIGKKPISEFLKNTPRTVRQTTKAQTLVLTDLTFNHKATFKILKHQIETETDAGKRQVLIRKYEALHQTRAQIEGTVEAIKQRCFPGAVVEDELVGYYRSAQDLFAFKTVAEYFRTTCFNWHEEESLTQFLITLSYMHVFARLCTYGFGAERIIEVITAVSSESLSVFL